MEPLEPRERSERAAGATVRDLRERCGLSPEAIVGRLAHSLGLVRVTEGDRIAAGAAASGDVRSDVPRMTALEVAAALRPPREWRRDAWPLPLEWQGAPQRSAK